MYENVKVPDDWLRGVALTTLMLIVIVWIEAANSQCVEEMFSRPFHAKKRDPKLTRIECLTKTRFHVERHKKKYLCRHGTLKLR